MGLQPREGSRAPSPRPSHRLPAPRFVTPLSPDFWSRPTESLLGSSHVSPAVLLRRAAVCDARVRLDTWGGHEVGRVLNRENVSR